MNIPKAKLVDLSQLLCLREAYRRARRTVAWTNGCFDLLHAGHIGSLKAAREMGDVLVVGINSDDSVRQLKGEGRPILPATERVQILSALECVDHVLIFSDLTPAPTLELLRPDVHCKGAEYAPPHGRPIPEQAIVEAYGGRVAFLPLLPMVSTSALIERIRDSANKRGETRASAALSILNAPLGPVPPAAPALEPPLSRLPGKRILIVGDVMLDEYVWGSVRRISPEAPVPIVQLEKRSYLPGGAANAAANVAGLGVTVDLLGIIGADEAGARLRDTLQDRGIGVDGLLSADGQCTTVKSRIIANSQQVVRVDRERVGAFPAMLEERLLAAIEDRLHHVDACIVSDYAKGVVSPTLARHAIQRGRALGKPVIVDPKGTDFRKYRGATVVKPNLHEAELFLKRALDSNEDVAAAGQGLLDFLGGSAVLITRGAAGMSLYQRDRPPLHIPALAREVYDVTGAGDTVISTLTVALAAGATPEQAACLASRAAAICVGRVGTTTVRLEELTGHGHINTEIPAQN